MTEPLILPDALASYISETRIRRAVDLLLGDPEVPEQIEWDEIPAFFDALVAAQQVQADHARTLVELWRRVWESHLGPDLVPMTAADQVEFDWYGPTHVVMWDESCFGRGFRWRGNARLRIFFTVQLDPQAGARAGYSVLVGDDFDPVETESFVREGDDEGWIEYWTPEHLVPAGTSLDIAQLLEAAAAAAPAVRAWAADRTATAKGRAR